MAINEYPINQVVRLSASFTVGGVLTDPTEVILFVQKPDSSESTYYYSSGTVSKLSTGTYYHDLMVDDSGNWYYRFEGDGVEAADERQFIARRSEFYGGHFAS